MSWSVARNAVCFASGRSSKGVREDTFERHLRVTRQRARMRQGLFRLPVWIATVAMAMAIALFSLSAHAANEDQGATFLTPFPDGDVYQISAFGDGFAEGLLSGLIQAFNADVRLNIDRQINTVPPVGAADFEAKVAALEQKIASKPLGAAVVMIGENVWISLRNRDGKRLAMGGEEWVAEFTRRIDLLMRAFKRKNVGVYWVGLPILARNDANDIAQRMNGVLRERAYLNGYKYIDAYQGFTDEAGGYSAYGPDLEGAIRLLRLRNGVHFTVAGNRKLAHFVEKELRSDLNQAKSNRNLPLLGAEAEQARINPGNANKTPSPTSPAANAADAGKSAPTVRSAAPSSAATDTSGDQKADNGRVTLKLVNNHGREETQTIEIVRPAIPASVVALMARREGSGQRGDLIVDQIAGGYTLMSSITPPGGGNRGRLSPTQAPYFRLLVKGERLQPKPGRADDVAWPPKPDSTSNAKMGETSPRG